MTCTCNYCVAWLPATAVTKLKIIEGGQRWTQRAGFVVFPLLASLLHCGLLSAALQLTHPQPWEPELESGTPPALWEEALPIISCPHSRWLDSCRPRPVVSIGSAQEAMAAKRQQQQYTDRARYTEDSSITWATKGVIRAPTLAIPLLVPNPKALVAVGYTSGVYT